MEKKGIWDKIVDKAIDRVLGALLTALAGMFATSAVILQFTSWPWYWRRAAMAAVLTVGFNLFLKFGPRWLVPRSAATEPAIHVRAAFDEEGRLMLAVNNIGQSDEFVACVNVVGGITFPFPVLPFPVRWFQHSTERREILKGATQHLHLLTVHKVEPSAPAHEGSFGVVHMFGPADDTVIHPIWATSDRLANPLWFHLEIRAADQGTVKTMYVHVFLAAAATNFLTEAVAATF